MSDFEVDGQEIAAASVMDDLNKLVHAEKHVETVEWANGTFVGFPKDALSAARLVAGALILSSRQLGRCVSQMLHDAGHIRQAYDLIYRRSQVANLAISPPAGGLWPANMLVFNEKNVNPVCLGARKFDAVLAGHRPDGRLLHDGEMMLFCFLHYRARALRFADYALSLEEAKVGPLDHDSLTAVEMPLIITSEMAAMLASWLPVNSPSRHAAAVLADSIRSTLWLWLEDDMRAMAALRVGLEQTARMRVWRLKPQHGPRLEAMGKPTQWLDRAGWGRLSALNRALGEMSHFRPGVHWNAAYELLIALNPEADQSEARFLGRRYAMEAVTRLAMREVREQVRVLDANVASAFDTISVETMAGGPEVDERLETYLNHAQTLRRAEFPESSGWQEASESDLAEQSGDSDS